MKKLTLLFLALLIAVPSWAVFDEKDLSQTLSELRYELSQEVDSQSTSMTRLNERDIMQKKEMLRLIKKCNELSLMLYSQKQDCTFDLTYALKQVTAEYEAYNANRLPFEDLMARLNLEIERYARLVEVLRRLPPQLMEIEGLSDELAYHNDSISDIKRSEKIKFISESLEIIISTTDSLMTTGHRGAFFLDERGMEDRDSCIHYAVVLLNLYSDVKGKVVEDREDYEEARLRIKEAYDYAQDRYRELQKKTFKQQHEKYVSDVLGNFKSFRNRAWNEAGRKYLLKSKITLHSPDSTWRGPVFVKYLIFTLMGLVISMVFGFLSVFLASHFIKKFRRINHAGVRTGFSMLVGMLTFVILLVIARITKPGSFVYMASAQMLTYCWMVIAILASILFRLREKAVSSTIVMYLPLILLSLLIILFRIVFISDMMMTLFFPPLLLITFVCMLLVCISKRKYYEKSDIIIGWISVALLAISTVMGCSGYVFLSILLVIGWLFLVSSIETIFAIRDLVGLYERGRLVRKVEEASSIRAGLGMTESRREKGDFFSITWFDDMMKMCIIPVFAVIAFPFSVRLALDVFDLHDTFLTFLRGAFFDIHNAEGQAMFQISVLKLGVSFSLFFIFRYIAFSGKSLFREIKINKCLNIRNVVNINDVNFALANNIISVIVWFIYAVTLIILLKIPVGAISMVATGLAAGVGLALKDVINNFIYGIQLMSGRLRVGDWIDVNDVRGKVEEISYQSTQIETIEGATMSFLNSDLFTRNFRNLTRSDKYELIQIFVGVGYGSDLDQVRQIILKALTKLQVKDSFGRDIVDKSREVTVEIHELASSSVDLAIWQYVLVSHKYTYESDAREVIYNALNENGIEMPCPQTDVHIKQ